MALLNAVVFSALVAAVSAAPSTPAQPAELCTLNGYDGVLVMDVAYDAPSQWACAGKTETMTMWCLPKGSTGAEFSYCCDSQCEKFDVPEERTCTVDDEEYIVGQTYDVTLNGKSAKMWCTDEDTVVTCCGNECGSTLQLTPPGTLVAKPAQPAPIPPPVVPVPPKPYPPRPYPPQNPDMNKDCVSCTSKGFVWNADQYQCAAGCSKIAGGLCFYTPQQCSAPLPGYKDCESCLSAGLAWQATANKCTKTCDMVDMDCLRGNPTQCSDPIPL